MLTPGLTYNFLGHSFKCVQESRFSGWGRLFVEAVWTIEPAILPYHDLMALLGGGELHFI